MPRKPRVGDGYTTGSFRDGLMMIVIILAVLVALWLALGVSGAPEGG